MLASQEGLCSTELNLVTVLWRSWVKLQNTSAKIRIWWPQQQTRCSKMCFIDSLKLAVHVSGDSFAHLQEHFDCMYSFLEQCTDSAVCCRPVTQVGWNQFYPTCVTGRQQTAEKVHCSDKLYIQSKCSWRWAKLSPETCRASFRFLWPCIVSKVWKKNQQDATIRCLLLITVSKCFGHHYAHLQEKKGPVTAFGVYWSGFVGCGW